MSILSTKGLQLFIGNAGVTPVAIAAGDMTAISNANPAVLSIASTTGMAQGDLIIIKGTGNKHIDGMVFVAGTIVADTSIVLTGLDLSAEAAPVDASTATGKVWGKTGMTTKVCASEISINSGQPGTVSIATFCNPTASVPSVVVEAGTMGAQVAAQIKAVLITIVYSGIGSAVLLYIVKAVVGLRVPNDDERQGLDLTSHGEQAYHS